MRDNFNAALGFVLRHEGGYVNDPDDPGGETKFGISRKYHPDVNIKDLTENEAGKIYLDKYWLPTCDILAFPKDVIWFDTCVNMGRDDANAILGDSQSWEEMLAKRIKRYYDKVAMRPRKMKYFFGWVQRVLDLRTLIRDEMKGG